MRQGAKRILAKPVVKKEPISPEMLRNIVMYFGEDKMNPMHMLFGILCSILDFQKYQIWKDKTLRSTKIGWKFMLPIVKQTNSQRDFGQLLLQRIT